MTYYGPEATTLLFEGTDLQAIDGILVTDLAGIFAPGTRRGDHDTIPGRPGQVGAHLPYEAYAFTVGVTILASGHYAMLTTLRAVGEALKGDDGLGQLQRRLDDGAGGYVTHTANGQFAELNSFTLLNAATGQTALTFVNLDGAWKSPTGEWLVP